MTDVAWQIVSRNAGVKPGERVWIKVDGEADTSFVDALAIAVGRAEAHPVVTRFSNDMLRGWYQRVPESVDAKPDPWLWGLYENADVLIEIDAFDYGIFALASEARFQAWDAANGGVIDRARERGMRILRIGNGLYPEPGRALSLGVSEPELAAAFWPAVAVAPDELEAIGLGLQGGLSGAETIRLTAPNGTDLSLRIATRQVVLTTGGLAAKSDPEKLNISWLPGGEVTLGVDPASAQGRLVVERVFFDGEELRDLVFEFGDGRLMSLNSASDVSRLAEMLASAPPGLDSVTGLKIGINPAIDDWRLLPWMGKGVVSIGLGANRLLGGEIDLPFLVFLSLKDASVFVDGRLLVGGGLDG